MGLMDFLNFWEYLGSYPDLNRKVHRKIVKTLKKKASKKQETWLKKWEKRHKGIAPYGRTIRGRKVLPSIPAVIVYAKGEKFRYKGKKDRLSWFDSHGYGVFLQTGKGMRIWRKTRKKYL